MRAPEGSRDPTLRRIERLSAGWFSVSVVGSLVAWGGGAALVLTLGSAVAILAFRSLERVVARLAPASGGGSSSLPVVLHFALLAFVPFLALWLNSRQTLAFLIGFSCIPLGLMSEAALQLFGTLRRN